MEHDYNFFADLLSTFRSVNDWTKALIILAPLATLSACFIAWLYLRRKPAGKVKPGIDTSGKGDDRQHAALPFVPLPEKQKQPGD